MTRGKQLIEAANLYEKENGESNVWTSFYEGAKWADENPKSPWISVNDDLPCNHEDLLENKNYTKYVLAIVEWNDDPSKKHIEVCNMCKKIGSFDVDFY